MLPFGEQKVELGYFRKMSCGSFLDIRFSTLKSTSPVPSFCWVCPQGRDPVCIHISVYTETRVHITENKGSLVPPPAQPLTTSEKAQSPYRFVKISVHLRGCHLIKSNKPPSSRELRTTKCPLCPFRKFSVPLHSTRWCCQSAWISFNLSRFLSLGCLFLFTFVFK